MAGDFATNTEWHCVDCQYQWVGVAPSYRVETPKCPRCKGNKATVVRNGIHFNKFGRDLYLLPLNYAERIKELALMRELGVPKWVEPYKKFCAYCGRFDVGLDLHHIIPLILGGATSIPNEVYLCMNCHQNPSVELQLIGDDNMAELERIYSLCFSHLPADCGVHRVWKGLCNAR